jgi:t-SNARE complex subunit (syntaxin)
VRNVEERYKAIQTTERRTIELAQLFQDLKQILQQHKSFVADVERNRDKVRENDAKSNKEVGTAILLH